MKKKIASAIYMTLFATAVYAQGVKMSTFNIAPSIDTGRMKFVIVYDAGGSYQNQQLRMGTLINFLGNAISSGISIGYGINYTGLNIKVDSGIVFPHALGSLAAGYGLNYSGRTFKTDTNILFPKLAGTFDAGYGLSLANRTYKADTGVLFPEIYSGLFAGYGITYAAKTFKADTGVTFPKLASTLAAGYGLSYAGRTFGLDTNKVTTKESRLKGLDSVNALMMSFYKDSTFANAGASFAPSTFVSNKLYTVSYNITAQASDLLINNGIGTWANGQVLLFYIKSSTSTARNITYGSNYIDGTNVTRPASTIGTKMLVIEFQWNSNLSKMICLGTDSY